MKALCIIKGYDFAGWYEWAREWADSEASAASKVGRRDPAIRRAPKRPSLDYYDGNTQDLDGEGQ